MAVSRILIMSTTHFGFKTVEEKDKARHVRGCLTRWRPNTM